MVACLRMREEVLPTTTEAAMEVKEALLRDRGVLASIPAQVVER